MNFEERVKFLEGILAAPCRDDNVRFNLIMRALRLLSDVTENGLVFRYTIAGSQNAADHVRQYHGNNPKQQCSRDCGDGALHRAHPVSVATLARPLADAELSAHEALKRLGHAVLLTKKEHGKVGDFETLEQLEVELGAALVRWPLN